MAVGMDPRAAGEGRPETDASGGGRGRRGEGPFEDGTANGGGVVERCEVCDRERVLGDARRSWV
jgi:hypothetical protein